MSDFAKNQAALFDLKKPKAVIFDWDNTLVDTWPLIQTAIDTTMEKMGREPWGLEKVRNTVHKSMRESFPEIFGDEWQVAGEIYKNTYRAINLKQLQLLPGAMDLIEGLSSKGILQFVVSNKMGSTLRQEIKNIGIDQHFFAIIGSNDAYADKPSKDPVELALMGSDLVLGQDEIWFVGDTIADISCAYNSGCQPILYGHSNQMVSKTIPASLLSEKNPQGILPVYFDHQKLLSLIS